MHAGWHRLELVVPGMRVRPITVQAEAGSTTPPHQHDAGQASHRTEGKVDVTRGFGNLGS